MVIVKIMGGLGNQLFQYAYARSLKELGYDVFLDNTSFFDFEAHSQGTTYRNYLLDNFEITINPANKNICKLFCDASKISIITRLFYKLKKVFILRLKDKNFSNCINFSPEVFNISNNTYISGYFQSEKYFIKIRDLLINELKLKKEISFFDEENLFKNEKNIVAIHIRRGDYLSLGLDLNIEYYHEALRIIETKIQNPYFFIFSDDLDFCKNNLQLINKKYSFININRQYTDCEEFILMSRCHHHIIANSSFSWWAAWLSHTITPDIHIVIAPSKWDHCELPDNWIRV
jgi:hypothetical protein